MLPTLSPPVTKPSSDAYYWGESVIKIPASILKRKRLEVASILFLRSFKRKRKRFDDGKSKATPGAGSQRHLLSACRSNNTIPASATSRHTANLLPASRGATPLVVPLVVEWIEAVLRSTISLRSPSNQRPTPMAMGGHLSIPRDRLMSFKKGI